MKNQKITNESHRKKFATEAKCLEALLHFRIKEDELCFNPHCNRPIKTHWFPLKARRAYICRNCLGHFYPMTSSLFEHSHVALPDWFAIIYKMLLSRNGVAGYELHRDYGYGTPAVYRLMHLIRSLMGECLDWKFEDNAFVEIDESYLSIGNSGMGRNFHFPRGRGSDKNANILVITERMGKAKLYVIPSSDEDSILPIILKEVDKSCLIVTDQWSAYNKVKQLGYNHITVNHKDPVRKDRYVRGMASTNNAENIFNLIKRSVRGTYRHIGYKYLANYLNEFSFKYTYRNESDYGFSKLMDKLTPLSEHYKEKYEKKSQTAA